MGHKCMAFVNRRSTLRAGIHGSDQLEVGGEGDDFIFHRLAHDFEDACAE